MPSKNNRGTSLPQFLKLLTTKGDLSMSTSMSLAGKLIPAGFDSQQKLSSITSLELVKLGITDEEQQKGILKAGDQVWGVGDARKGKGKLTVTSTPANGSLTTRKRKLDDAFVRDVDLDHPLPNIGSSEIPPSAMSLDFKEESNEMILQTQSVVINRAPVMTAWATVVAERLGFKREEALSIAHAYTEMNANSKAKSLGISPKKTDTEIIVEKIPDSQPVIELMGRKIPVMSLQSGDWRAIVKGAIVEPTEGFTYIQRCFRQQMSVVIGSLRLLANVIDENRINEIGYQLYLDFRPQVEGWGKRSELKMADILQLRQQVKASDKVKSATAPSPQPDAIDGEPTLKKPKIDKDMSNPTILGEEGNAPIESNLPTEGVEDEWGDLDEAELAQIDC